MTIPLKPDILLETMEEDMKKAEVQNKLNEASIYPDTLSIKNGMVCFRKCFFYTHGNSSDKIAARIKKVFPDMKLIEANDIWKPFRGGASVARSSHFLVKFKI